MTHANVYRYFPSKAALADAVTADWLRPLEAELAQVADAPDPADDKLERMLMAIASTQRDKLETDPNLFDLYVTAHEENRVVSRKHRQRVRMLVERVIEEGVGPSVFTLRRRGKGRDAGARRGVPFHPSAGRPPRQGHSPHACWTSAFRRR